MFLLQRLTEKLVQIYEICIYTVMSNIFMHHFIYL